jgi:GTP-binding protein
MTEYLRHYNLDGYVVATKADKVSRNELAKNLNQIRKTLNLGKEDRLIPVSALKKTGYDELMEAMDAIYQL